MIEHSFSCRPGIANILPFAGQFNTGLNMALENEIETARRKVNTDEYGMSIGEIVTMYEKQELVINPSFQRLFRWAEHQKSKFIESILLGIPIPPVFVFETDKGQWELIDGLQRLSTILEFMGLLVHGGNRPNITDDQTLALQP